MRINHTGCNSASDYLSSLKLPDSISEVQWLKGIRLALNTITQTITGIEKLLHQSIAEKADTQFITHSIKREQRWIKKILTTVKIKSNYPLLGDRLIINMPGSVKLEASLAKLSLAKIRLNSENTNLFSLLDILREFKQKLQYNIEVIYNTSLLYKSDYILCSQDYGKDSQKPNCLQPLVFFELLTLARRYCIRLTSSLLPANLKNIYFNLFLFFLQHIRRLYTTNPTAMPLQTQKDFLSITDTVLQAEFVQNEIHTLYTLRSLINEILSNPRGLVPRAYAYG